MRISDWSSDVCSSDRAAVKAREAAESHGWATPRTVGSAVASDAFFPFADGLLAAVEAGATCVIQPGGSIRDDEVLAAANDAGLAMVFTGMRHFRHCQGCALPFRGAAYISTSPGATGLERASAA